MYGVIAQALMMLLNDGDAVKEVLNHVHLTTPIPICREHRWHTFWLEPMVPICGKCGKRATARRTRIFLTAPLNPHVWQPKEERGELIRRQFPRRIYALSPAQYFKFHLILDEDRYLDCIKRCFRIIFCRIFELDLHGNRVGMEYGLGLSTGWGKKFGWGFFSAEIQEMSMEYEVLDSGTYTALTQAPTKEGNGVELLSGMRKNLRYISDRDISSSIKGAKFTNELVIAEGSVVRIDTSRTKLFRYTINMKDLTFVLLHEDGERGVFTRTVRDGQRVVLDRVKAVEAMYMLAW